MKAHAKLWAAALVHTPLQLVPWLSPCVVNALELHLIRRNPVELANMPFTITKERDEYAEVAFMYALFAALLLADESRDASQVVDV